MATRFFAATSITAVDAFSVQKVHLDPATTLVDGDICLCGTGLTVTAYHLDATSGAAESSPDVLLPNDEGGDKRWLLIAMDSLIAHASSHENGGDDEMTVLGLSGLLADDQHVLDSEAKAAAVQSGAITNGVTLAPTHDAVFDVKTTADAAQTAGEVDSTISTHTSNADAHHPQSHTVVSHSDTSATGAELDTLTDNSIADTLHRHSELVAPDGSPDPALSVDNAGDVDITGSTTISGNVGIGTTPADDTLTIAHSPINSTSNGIDLTVSSEVTSSGAYCNNGISITGTTSYVGTGATNTANTANILSSGFMYATDHLGTMDTQNGINLSHGIYLCGTTGAITNSYGIKIDSLFRDGTIGNLYSHYVKQDGGTDGTISGDSYMFYGTNDGAGTVTGTRYGLYLTGEDNNYLSGNLTLANGTGINEFSTDGTLAGDSDDAVPTEKAVKTYVATEVATSISGTVYTKTSSATLTAAEVSGLNTIHNEDAIGEVILTWLALVTGQEAVFYVNDNQYLQIKAPAATTIRMGADVTAVAGYIRSNTVGNWVRIKAMPDGLVVFGSGGVWTYDE